MRATLRVGKSQDMEHITGTMEENIQECIRMTKRMVTVNCMIQKAILFIREYGEMMK